MKRRLVLRWLLLTVLASVLLLGMLSWRFVWRSPPYYLAYGQIDLPVPILTTEQYEQVSGRHARPYVVQLETAGGALLLYGASHTKDPDNPQIADLRRRWDAFRPTAALVEGRLGFLVEGVSDPVRKFGESGLVYGLARRHGVPAFTWEPSIDYEVAEVLNTHPKERVALFYILRPYFSNYRHGRPADPDATVERYRATRTRWPGLEDAFSNVSAIDAVWKRDFEGLKDWRDTSDEFGLPGYLKDVWSTSNAVRDEHFARVIIDLVRQGHRVLAVCGSSHAVKLEPALGAALAGEPRAKNEAVPRGE
jgi:hypothetical protein